ncbi:hypothetical protein G3A_17475 [Bacillus sp. 17376]|uniref:HTH cro/C1-type domain-containing protein n=1 Tax=Mesobacillus boroniphilus JCM 21738 TaxID=1294265 RepID=W4RV05_9BACI|nr:hypothetical protein G3A_17475 [Bacillus sp. 17376]GAE48141.1 hypothetical protein JCM21738_5222 [Mesobacillus boroniphilus JCM 21738]
MYIESLGTRLRIERFKRNMTQGQVCQELKMKVSTLSQIENDKGVHFDSTIRKLLKFYGINA